MLTKSDNNPLSTDACGTERFRPQFHFTARKNWINDPNGLVYFEGEYHLFFQYNPYGKDWGHMSWGHAVSPDLIHWRELAVAIPETDQMIFSGCVIVDRDNLSGLGDGTSPPLLAYFTAYDERRDIQSQHLAFSHDRGRSFTHYEGNPIIDHDLAHFRDPKVFYHAESDAWVMLVAMAREHTVRFYRSSNLLDWSLAGSFGPSGSVSGQWECPDLFQVPVEDDLSQHHWVLKVDVDTGLVDGGSGAQYFVGAFDGFAFTPDHPMSDRADLVDLGPDFYAAVTWADLPTSQPRPVWIGWQSNHQSGRAYPTDPWRGAMSIPRELFLFEESGRLRLGQRPVASLASLRRNTTNDPDPRANQALAPICLERGDCFEQQIKLEGWANGVASVAITDGQSRLLTISVRFDRSEITFERHGGLLDEKYGFARTMTTTLPRSDLVDLTILFDVSLVEIFVDEGRRSHSACVFPKGKIALEINADDGVQITVGGGTEIARSMTFLE